MIQARLYGAGTQTSAAGSPPAPAALIGRPIVSGLSAPPPRSIDSVGTWRPTSSPALTTQSYTSTPQGGAPGAYFGPPGVAGAPVPAVGGLSLTPQLLLGLALVGVAAYLVLR